MNDLTDEECIKVQDDVKAIVKNIMACDHSLFERYIINTRKEYESSILAPFAVLPYPDRLVRKAKRNIAFIRNMAKMSLQIRELVRKHINSELN